MITETQKHTAKQQFLAAVFLGLVTWAYCVVNSLTRSYFNGNTESDFVLSYIGEASRILSGQAPLVSHHPPLYPYLIAWLHKICSSWLLTGLLLTWVSLAGCLFLNYRLFRELCGPAAGTGSVLAFLASPILMAYGSMATSDLFFLFLYTACLVSVYSGLKRKNLTAWILPGLILGAAFLSRSNAITLLILFAVPFFTQEKISRRLFSAGVMFAAFFLPVLLWYFYSKKMGTGFMPSGTYANLAMTYFSPGDDRMSADAYILAKEKFTSLFDVITYSPLTMLRIYISDFFSMLLKNAFLLVSPFITLAAFFGAAPAVREAAGRRDKGVMLVFVVLALITQTLLTNLKTYEYRYYIFWLPVIGALAGAGIGQITDKARNSSKAFLTALAAVILLSLPVSAYKSYTIIHSPFQNELETAIPAVEQVVPESGILVGRKSHLSYYTNRDYLFIPNANQLEKLRAGLERMREPGRELYLFFGYYEAATRPGLRMLLNPREAPYWLEKVAGARAAFPWNLYRVRVPTDYEAEMLHKNQQPD